MNITKLFVGVALLMTAMCGAQELTEPGWINTLKWIEAQPASEGKATSISAEGAGGVSMMEGEGDSAIAEASTPEIEALARGLVAGQGGPDNPTGAKRIFDFVHDHIRHVFYFGSKKGAQLTLLERSGNDFDQCALLMALLRAAGYPDANYQFGLLQMPYDRADHQDLRHWLQLSVVNTNWPATRNYFGYLLASRGYPNGAFYYFDATNTLGFHRVWVKLPIGGTNYLLDPAFKVSEPIAGANLPSAMGLDTNALVSVAGGTHTADYVQNLNEPALRNTLGNYTSNLLVSLQNNLPNARVVEVLGGWEIQPSTNPALSQSLLFPGYTGSGFALIEWDHQPTNLMAQFTVSLAGTNHHWWMPELQGQRLALTFDSNALAELSLEDQMVVTNQTTGSNTLEVVLSVDHPHGTWSTANNTLVHTNWHDHTLTNSYARTNASYALVYAFEPSREVLRYRQGRLDAYKSAGFDDASRDVVTETLNVMGLSYLLQFDQAELMIEQQRDLLHQTHHRFGRMGQENGKGYYGDVYMYLSGSLPASGAGTADWTRWQQGYEVSAYFGSALEHGVIEQLQSSNLLAASTMKVLQLGNTNSLKTFLASSANWSSIHDQLTNYYLPSLNNLINDHFLLLLPQDGLIRLSDAGSWTGYGILGRRDFQGEYSMSMLIGGAYSGGYSAYPNVTVNPDYVQQTAASQPTYFDPNGAFNSTSSSAEPVRLSDGAFEVGTTDLALGQAEPRGFSFHRYYNSARRQHNPAGMADGWTHNYAFRLDELSAPAAGLGDTTPAQMAPMLVATRAALELYSTNADPKNWLLTALIAKWGVDQLINNAVSITLGQDTVQFIRQPDGVFTPPANCTMTLGQAGANYSLFQRHGNTLQFDANQRLTNIVDQYGKGLALTYNASNWVATATDWKNRTLTLNYSGTPLRLTSISDGTRTVSYGYSTTYNSSGDLTSITDPETETSTLVYDTNHQIIATGDALSQTVVSNLYDGFGRVIEQYTQGDPNKTWRFYWSGFANTEEDPTGAQRRFFYDRQGPGDRPGRRAGKRSLDSLRRPGSRRCDGFAVE